MRIEEVHSGLLTRLRARRPEIEAATLTRIHTLADSTENSDPEYAEGLRAAVSAALDYGIEAVGRSEEHSPPLPTVLLTQARLAARNGVGLETVLRRYLAGSTLLGDYLIEESARGGLPSAASLKRVLRLQATLLDRLIAAVSEEYAREAKARPISAEQRRAERLQRLLDGELLDLSEFGYDFSASHLGLIVIGARAAEALRGLAASLDHNLLAVSQGETSVWAWLGSRRALGPAELQHAASGRLGSRIAVAVGEPASGLEGWRLSHRQARAALPIAMRGPESLVRYADVALLASVLQDELLATSLRRLYLEPLAKERDDGEALRQTLRAYFAAGHHISSAAAALGVTRQTVTKRLRATEALLTRPLDDCAAELDIALRLEELGDLPLRDMVAGSPEPAAARER
jgi:hypothetical protein